VLDKINAAALKGVKGPAFDEHLKNIGLSTIGASRAEFDTFRAEQVRRTIDLVGTSGIKVQLLARRKTR
jgi:hypothetical protein